jgi:hypothetical protein
MNKEAISITIEPLDVDLSVCKVEDYSQVDICRPFCFTGSTDEEFSLVCPTDMVPGNTTERDDGWRAFRIVGVLDFSLVGILGAYLRSSLRTGSVCLQCLLTTRTTS